MKMFIQPTKPENFEKTISGAFSAQKLIDAGIEDLYSGADAENLHAWGANSKRLNTVKTFKNKLEVGDIVLFCHSKTVLGYGYVAQKIQSSELGKSLWDDEDFEYVYLLKDICLDPPFTFSELLKTLGYSSNWNSQGFSCPVPQTEFFNNLYPLIEKKEVLNEVEFTVCHKTKKVSVRIPQGYSMEIKTK